MKIRIILILLICLAPVSSLALNSRDAAIDAHVFSPKADGSEKDGMAKVYELHGKVVITPKGSPVERDLKVGDEIHIGDAVYTEKGASLSIGFDNRKLNAVRIPEGSKATFTSIEPTDIKLENGAIFSVVNGLAQGSTWKVTTPSAVAAVRGTVFLVRYEAANGQMYAATVDVPDDGKTSAIEIQSLDGSSVAEIIEGKEMSMKEGEAPSSEMVQELSPEAVAEVQAFFEQVAAEQAAEAVPENNDVEQKTEGDGEQKSTEESGESKSEDGSSSENSDDQIFEDTTGSGEENPMEVIDDQDLGDKGADIDPGEAGDIAGGTDGQDDCGTDCKSDEEKITHRDSQA